MRVTPKNLVPGTSIAGNINSATQQLDQVYAYSMQAIIVSGGSVNGTLKLQCSNNSTDWNDIEDSSFSIVAAGSTMWNISSSNYKYVRCVWTVGSASTGTLNVLFYARGF